MDRVLFDVSCCLCMFVLYLRIYVIDLNWVSEVLGPFRDPKLNIDITSVYGVVPFNVAVGFVQEK